MSVSRPLAVSIKIKVPSSSLRARTASHTSKPVLRGIITSSKTSAGRCCSMASMAS